MLNSTRRNISYPNPDRSDSPDIPLHIKNLVDAIEVDVFYTQGLLSARPVSTVGTPGIIGRIHFATDNSTMYWDYGTGWQAIGSVGVGSVTNSMLATDSVDASKIQADAVGSSELQNDSVTGAEIANGAVGTTELADDSVTAAKIAADAVGSSEIAANAVNTSEIADDAVTAAKIATDAVGSAEILANAVGTSEIADDAVTAAKIAAGAVGASEIADGTITTTEVTAGHFATANGYGTVLPTSGLFTGYRFTLFTGAAAFQCDLVYRPDLSATWPWYVVGVGGAQEGTTTITIPFAGDYYVEVGAQGQAYGPTANVGISLTAGGTTISAQAGNNGGGTQNTFASLFDKGKMSGLTATQVLTPIATGSISRQYIRAVPVRLG